MDREKPQSQMDHTLRPEDDNPVIVDALKLFEGRREIYLELDGVRYRLRITRRNKLILQK